MIRLGWARTSINKHVARVKHLFKWAVGREMIPDAVHHRLTSIEALEVGRSDAHETDPVKPVAIEHVEAVYPFVSRQVRAMIELQLASAMRSGEVVIMRTGDIDRSNPQLWIYRPQQHKGLHRGHDREIYLGPRAQTIVKPFLRMDPSAFIFDPREAESDRRAANHERRRTPLHRGNVPGSKPQGQAWACPR
jgi:integrase